MKKIHIIIIIVIAATLAIIVSSFGSFGTYETFESAGEQPGKTYMVVAQLDTTVAVTYDPLVNANEFSFYAYDKENNRRKVVFKGGAKPTDFERSEQLSMTGAIVGDEFHCKKIIMKCPSKYEEDQIITSES